MQASIQPKCNALIFNQIGDLGCSAFGEALKTTGSKLELLNLNMKYTIDLKFLSIISILLSLTQTLNQES